MRVNPYLNKWQSLLCLLIVVIMSTATLMPINTYAQEDAADELSLPDEVDDDVLAGDDAMSEADQLDEGDNKKFTVVTKTPIDELSADDVYKNNGTFFKVVEIGSKGPKGGKFYVVRYKGNVDPGMKWAKISGNGPNFIRSHQSLFDRFKAGGPLMYPIGILLLLMIIVALRSVMYYRKGVHMPKAFIDSGRQAIKEGNLEKFETLALNQKGLLARACSAMVVNFASSDMAEINERVETAAGNEVNRMRFPVRMLNFIAVVSPLVGLLGTVTGMIACFDSLSGENATASKAMEMASGIKQALLTTAFGLCVAVPSLFVYFLYNQKLQMLIGDCETETAEFVHLLKKLRKESGFEDDGDDDDEEDA
ncbi:MAG: MotA/TolQ/ExbB proton channel family protein [Lentisphaeria bacterium]|nr:MotA/TolQ/ExbB proton channel family protein [Lentisphaeria bacterium]NQZ68779.1 MotA/TolQ/ExbB proton channel family protein [Lentisphaeria bacterium]